MRQGYLVQAMTSATGLGRRTIMRYSYVKRATPKYESACINFSGSGIPANRIQIQLKRTKGVANTSTNSVEWLRPKASSRLHQPTGQSQAPAKTRSQKTAKNTYRKKTEPALAPSLATKLYLIATRRRRLKTNPPQYLSSELVTLLDELLDE